MANTTDPVTVQSKPKFEVLGQDQVEGYCDPVTGACIWPGAAAASANDELAETAGDGRNVNALTS